MDKKIISKLVKLKIQEYKLLKELLPESIKTEIDSLESKFIDFAKEIALEILTESSGTSPGNKEPKEIKKVHIES